MPITAEGGATLNYDGECLTFLGWLRKLLESDKPWAQERLPLVQDRIRVRLCQLSARLADGTWLEDEFSAGDLMMIAVLLRLKPSGMLEEFPNLAAYVARGEARPAYQRAFAAQSTIPTEHS